MRSRHLDHGQVAHDRGFLGDVLHQQHVDELVKVSLDAAGLVVVGVHRNRHA